jgi:hypothetical protein
MSAQLTHHAQARLRQRAIPEAVIDLLIDYGTPLKTWGGAQKLFFDKSARKTVWKRHAEVLAGKEKCLNCYVVVADDCVITAGYLNHKKLTKR